MNCTFLESLFQGFVGDPQTRTAENHGEKQHPLVCNLTEWFSTHHNSSGEKSTEA